MKKLFNIREGWQSKDDWLPERLLKETLPTGVGAGIGLSPEELRQMIQSYYQARGWDENGFVPKTILAGMNLPGIPGIASEDSG
jgi:aldehyde:ferredoxin oxidoreductase